jgi:ferredoxin
MIKVTVDQARCTGCLRCVKIAQDNFSLDKNGKAQLISSTPQPFSPSMRSAVNGCPACAILACQINDEVICS